MRFISQDAHGVLDYLFATTALTMPRWLGWSHRSTRLMTSVAAFALGYALLTRYRLGVIKVLPMNAHLGIDAALSAFLAAAQFQLSEEESTVRATVLGMSAVGAMAALLTRINAPGEESRP